MFDFAKNGGIAIYALCDDGAVGMAVIANDYGYYKENFITGFGLPVVADFISADGSGRIIVVRSSNIYSLNDKNSSFWNSSSIAMTVLDVKSSGYNFYVLSSTAGDCVSRFDWSANGLVSDGISIADTPERFYFSGGALYIMADPGPAKNIYRIDSGIANIAISVPIASLGSYFSIVSGNFYCAESSSIYENTALKGTGVSIGNYAVLSSSEIYACILSTNHQIQKLISGTFQTVYTFPSTSGVMKIIPYKEGIIAVGLSGAGSENGLYLYHSDSNTVEKLSSRATYALYVR